MKKNLLTTVLITLLIGLSVALYVTPKPDVVLVKPASDIVLPDIYINSDSSTKREFEAIEVQE